MAVVQAPDSGAQALAGDMEALRIGLQPPHVFSRHVPHFPNGLDRAGHWLQRLARPPWVASHAAPISHHKQALIFDH